MYPILFEIGTISVSSIWILVCLGFLTSGIVLIQLTQFKSMKMVFLVRNFFPLLLWGLIGGRIAYIITAYSDIFANPVRYAPIRMIRVWDLGFEFWGVIAGMFLYLHHACKKNEENMQRWLDILTVAILVGLPFGHLGAYFEGLNFGRETNLPWGVTFDSFKVLYTVPIHPAQIYALVYSLIIAAIIVYLFMKKPLTHDGDITLTAAGSYAAMRFLEEFFRGDESLMLFGIPLAYYISGITIVGTGILLLHRYNMLNFIHKKIS